MSYSGVKVKKILTQKKPPMNLIKCLYVFKNDKLKSFEIYVLFFYIRETRVKFDIFPLIINDKTSVA